MSTVDHNEFLIQQIAWVEQRVRQLQADAQHQPAQQPQLLLECLEELWSMLEELRIAEEELQRQNEDLLLTQQMAEFERRRYQDLFEFAPDGYLVTDLYGKIREANQAIVRLFCADLPYLLDKPLVIFVPESSRRDFRTLLNQLPTIHRLQEWELPLCNQEGTLFQAAITVETVRNEFSKATALRWLIRDVTVRKQTEAKLHQIQFQNLQLVEADRLKDQFVTTISHELRTPIHVIMGFSELLLDDLQQQGNAQLIAMVEKILRSSTHLTTLIEEILDFSKLQAYGLKLQLERFELADLVAEITEDMRPLAMQKTLKFQTQMDPPLLWVYHDRTRLRQILMNLLSNAIKFTDVGQVDLTIQALPHDRVLFQVRDTGIGIAPIHQAHIFEDFWQADQSNTRRHNGTGLGLSITRSLVTLMAGQIRVASTIGAGTTFQVELPQHIPAI
ncbi:hypothetical protein BST81_11355 [Leptolyngbya sp. 'hensonii']|uniref:PAS domain-containing sensor histidine kinase n=1 Tax=Leptolyngbya sp. 'hensonii' TaxID=1922337 RepID=UPI00094F9492|nr:ATP-binding protein [Leptolyngbya sp. 'hensonii']OLP18313.1 hypothetical protein BST81_11355 [Leptolyngbya sp. 'hensonii']